MAKNLLKNFLRRIAQASSVVVFLFCLTLLIPVGILDYSTGNELRLYAFYFPSVAIMAWTGNRRLSISIVVLASITSFMVKLLLGAPYTHEFYRYFAACSWLLAFYAIAEICLSARALFDAVEQSNRQLRQATEELALYASRLAAIMDAVPAVIFVAEDAACQRITGNKIAHTLLGLPMTTNLSASDPSATVSRAYRVQKNGEEIPIAQRPMQLAASGESQFDFDFELVYDDGTLKSLRGDAVTFLDSNGRAAGAVGAFLDISDRKRIEIEMEKSLALQDAALASAMDAVSIFDTSGSLTHISESCRGFMRFKPDEATASNFEAYLQLMELFTPDGQRVPPELWLLPRALRGESDTNAEYIIRRKDTGESWVASFSFGPIRRKDGTILGGMMSARDITELRQLEQEKRDLELRVLSAQKLESLGILAGGIAHAFNNVLQVIQGHTELVSQAVPSNSPLQDSFQAIQSASSRATRLARHMLDFSGHGHFTLAPIALNEILRVVLQHHQESFPVNISIRIMMSGDLPMMEGDKSQIGQAVLSLITNALESIGDNEGNISLSTGTTYCDRASLSRFEELTHAGGLKPLPEGEYVYMEVTDTGAGIDVETLGKIFDPFFTTKFPGRGLGLSSALGIMRGHRGAITVASEVGVGSTFRLLFPVTEIF